jgi:hypothetical protein
MNETESVDVEREELGKYADLFALGIFSQISMFVYIRYCIFAEVGYLYL